MTNELILSCCLCGHPITGEVERITTIIGPPAEPHSFPVVYASPYHFWCWFSVDDLASGTLRSRILALPKALYDRLSLLSHDRSIWFYPVE